MDRGVPRLSVRRVPLAGHAASQLRILELRVTAALSVLDPDQDYAQVMVGVEDVHHPTRSCDVDLPTLMVNVIAVGR